MGTGYGNLPAMAGLVFTAMIIQNRIFHFLSDNEKLFVVQEKAVNTYVYLSERVFI